MQPASGTQRVQAQPSPGPLITCHRTRPMPDHPSQGSSFFRRGLSSILAAGLVGCGGGGGGAGPSGDTTTNVGNVFAAQSSETAPVGARVDLLGAGYMPFDHGATWTYAMLDPAGTPVGTSVVTLSNTAAVGGGRQLRFTRQEGSTTDTTDYVWRADGLYTSLADVGAPPGVLALIGELREYAFPSYAAGETRTVVRAGTWDGDVDGDGRPESFRLEYGQRYEGIVPLALPWDAAASAARMTATLRLAIQPSSAGAQALGVVSTSEEYFAAGVGLVKSTERLEDLNGVLQETPRSYAIVSADIGALHFAAPVPSAPAVVALPHAALAFDSTRNVYYASVPGTAATGANSIATIVPATGAVTYSAALGAAPDVLAVSPEGSFLYVGLRGAGQVVKLALPSLTEVARVTLGSDAFYGTYYAESLAVSPADPNVVAVSRASPTTSPRHLGVALISGTAILPAITQTHTGSNLITFGADGSTLYGFNNETTEFGLRRIDVAVDGLRQGAVVNGNGDFSTRSLLFASGQIYLGSRSWRASDLTDSGAFDTQAALCVPLASTLRAACTPRFTDPGTLTVWNAATFAQQATVPLPALGANTVKNLVPGRAGAMAVSVGDFFGGARIILLNDASL